MQAIIGIDIGTTNTKAVLFSKEGKLVASENHSYPHVSPSPGYDEIEADMILNAVVTVIQRIIASTNSETEICGIAFSSAMHGLMAVDENGQPLTNILTWADLRSAGEAAKIKFTPKGNRIYELAGTPIHAMTPLCKILWFKNNQPEIFKRAHKFVGIKEYIWFQFFGKYQIDYSMASSMGMFHIYDFHWLDESLELAGISSDKLSTPVLPTHIETNLSVKYQKLFGLKENIPFVIGSSDGCLANLGSHAVHHGDASLTIGTSGALRMTNPKPKFDPKQRIFNYILVPGLYISGGAMNNGGSAVQWYVKNFLSKSMGGNEDYGTYLKIIEEIPAGADGLIFLPYLFGERAPIWDANAKAVFFGIQPNHDAKHFLKAVVEAVCFALYQIGQSIEESLGTIKQIYASGGFTRSNAWVQTMADVFNKEIWVDNIADASAIGASMLGFHALGITENLDSIRMESGQQIKFIPNEKAYEIYQGKIMKFTALYEKLKDLF